MEINFAVPFRVDVKSCFLVKYYCKWRDNKNLKYMNGCGNERADGRDILEQTQRNSRESERKGNHQ